MTDVIISKRGRGRPKGSTNRPKVVQHDLSPEEVAALKRQLADSYAEAVVTQALAIDRKRRIKASIRSAFGKHGVQDLEPLIVAAQERLPQTAPVTEAA